MSTGLIPLVEPLGETADPAEVAARFLDLPYLLFLDSAAAQHHPRLHASGEPAGAEAHLGVYSFLTADPALVVRSKGARTEIRRAEETGWRMVSGDALTVARSFLPKIPAEPVSGLPPFQGGVAGYIGYDWGAVLERLPPARYDDLAVPDLV